MADGRLAAAVGEAQSAGAGEVHRVALGHGLTRAAVAAWSGGAGVMELASAPYVPIPTPGRTEGGQGSGEWG